MKDKTQALNLKELMQRHTLYFDYELALSHIYVKRSSFKKLSKGDILLLGLDSLNMILLDKNQICASAVLSRSSKVKIVQLNKSMIEQSDYKKYVIVKISFGMIQSKKLEIGYHIGVASLKLQEVIISVEDKNIAKGSLVNVDEEIAVQIEEVL